MKHLRQLRLSDTITGIIADDYNILPLLSRFNVPLGVANETLAEVCAHNNIDANALVLILNYVRTGVIDNKLIDKVAPSAVVAFLKNSHDYFITYKFVHIRQNLIAALQLEPENKSNDLILKFYDQFVDKVRDHFSYEEKKVFPYVRDLETGRRSRYSISIFERHHEEVEGALADLKNIILRYYRTTAPNLMYDVLVDIYNCEEDLASHSDVENNLLIPLVADLEKSMKQ